MVCRRSSADITQDARRRLFSSPLPFSITPHTLFRSLLSSYPLSVCFSRPSTGMDSSTSGSQSLAPTSSAAAPSTVNPVLDSTTPSNSDHTTTVADNDDKVKSSGKDKKKLGRPFEWHPTPHGQVMSTENITQYAINCAVDAANPKARAQRGLLDKIMAALGLWCDYDENNLSLVGNPNGTPKVVKDLGLMVGEARADEITRRVTFLKETRQVRLCPLSLREYRRADVPSQRVQGMLSAVISKSTNAASIREAEAEVRTIKAATGTAPKATGLSSYYQSSDLGWSRLKPSYIQLHGQEPTGPGAVAERQRHCKWWWDHQETEANKKLVTEAHNRYKKDHERLWAAEREAVQTATGDSLTAGERQS
jgi:hypothetical protein